MSVVDIQVTREGTAVCLVLSGEVDLTNWESVGDRINGEVSNRTTEVTVDLSAVTYLDSSGLRLLFKLAERLGLLQIGLTLVVPQESVTRLAIRLSGLDQEVEVRAPAD
jgi:anti-anti-sigma factor